MIRRFIVSKLLWSAGAFESQGTLGLGPDTVMKSWPVTPASVACFAICKMGGESDLSDLMCKIRVPPVGTCEDIGGDPVGLGPRSEAPLWCQRPL